MPTLLERIAARVALLHARRVYTRFLGALRRVEREQHQAMARTLALVGDSDFGRRHRLRSVRRPVDLRRAVPLQTYEDLRPYIERVGAGETGALFGPHGRVLMFAATSGTTSKAKLVPVTPQFVRDYRRGWNTFGLKLLRDHPQAMLRAILQSSGRHDAGHTSAGIPCGAITGLLAQTQKRIVRRYYVGCPALARLPDPRARYYALMRLGIVRDVGFAITANPATLIQMARTADEESEALIRDVHDGTLSAALVPDATLRRKLAHGLRPDRRRAATLAGWRKAHGTLRPRDYWAMTFLACWTGGSMGHYLQRLREWYGDVPVRDVGLLASEGRVSIPLADDTPAGVLDVRSALFEFVPAERCEAANPDTLCAWELEAGRDYGVVLTNVSGLVRYRLNDVVRVRGWMEQAPVVEFLYRAGGVASVCGEKLTESQAVEAVRVACRRLNLRDLDFVLAPCWDDPPYYRLTCESGACAGLAEALDRALCEQNEEYDSRRKSLRLGQLRVRELPSGTLARMDRRTAQAHGSAPEQYKRQCLFTSPGGDDIALQSTDQINDS